MTEPVGREKELAVLERAVAKLAGGDAAGGVVALVGDAGIGKSTLLAALCSRAEASGAAVLRGGTSEIGREVPFGLAIDALDDRAATLHPRRLESLGAGRAAELAAVLPSIARHAAPAAPAGGPAERFRYHRALRALLELLARERPLVLALDDLHWADEASLELVAHLLRRPPAAPFLLALALRRVAPATELLDAMRGLTGAEVLALEPLGEDAARELLRDVRDAGRASGSSARRAATRSTSRSSRAPRTRPARSRTRCWPRSRARSRRCRRARGGCWKGRRWWATRSTRSWPRARPSWRAPRRWRRSTRSSPTASCAPPPARASSRSATPCSGAPSTTARPPAGRSPPTSAPPACSARAAPRRSRMAHHLERCARPGDRDAAATLAEAAAASAAASPMTAAHWYGAALALLDGAEPEQRVRLLAASADALDASGHLEEAREAFVAALELSRGPERVDLVLGCADVEHRLGRTDDAGSRLREALAALAPGGDPRSRALLEYGIALNGLMAERQRRPPSRTRRARPRARRASTRPSRRARSAFVAHGLHNAGRPGEVREPLERAVAIARGVPDADLEDRVDGLILIGSTRGDARPLPRQRRHARARDGDRRAVTARRAAVVGDGRPRDGAVPAGRDRPLRRRERRRRGGRPALRAGGRGRTRDVAPGDGAPRPRRHHRCPARRRGVRRATRGRSR